MNKNFLNANEMKYFKNILKDIKIIKKNDQIIDKIKILKKEDIIPEIKDNLIKEISEREINKTVIENIDDTFKNNMLSIMSIDYFNKLKNNEFFDNNNNKNIININFERIKNYIKTKYIQIKIDEVVPIFKYILDKKNFIQIDNLNEIINDRITKINFKLENNYIKFFKNQIEQFNIISSKLFPTDPDYKINIPNTQKLILKDIETVKKIKNKLTDLLEKSLMENIDVNEKNELLDEINILEKNLNDVKIIDYVNIYNEKKNKKRLILIGKLNRLNDLIKQNRKTFLKINLDKFKNNVQKLEEKNKYEQKENEIILEKNELIKEYNENFDDFFTEESNYNELLTTDIEEKKIEEKKIEEKKIEEKKIEENIEKINFENFENINRMKKDDYEKMLKIGLLIKGLNNIVVDYMKLKESYNLTKYNIKTLNSYLIGIIKESTNYSDFFDNLVLLYRNKFENRDKKIFNLKKEDKNYFTMLKRLYVFTVNNIITYEILTDKLKKLNIDGE